MSKVSVCACACVRTHVCVFSVVQIQQLFDLCKSLKLLNVISETESYNFLLLFLVSACQDQDDNCENYESTMCTQYRPWATAHCQGFCNLCGARRKSKLLLLCSNTNIDMFLKSENRAQLEEVIADILAKEATT